MPGSQPMATTVPTEASWGDASENSENVVSEQSKKHPISLDNLYAAPEITGHTHTPDTHYILDP